MPDANDMDLVREFARDNSEAAFTELVRRHINLVYSVARRCTGNDGDAHDVAQAVFIILARKAAGLREKTLLTGWLYETTRFAAARLLRTNARRHAREQEAYMQSTLNDADTADLWEKLSPHLETAMGKLNAADRALLVLRFYENKTGPEAAALLGIREDAAHKRVTRALEKLRKVFAQRGLTLSGAAIAGAVSANSVQAAPVALVKTVTTAAIAKSAAGGMASLLAAAKVGATAKGAAALVSLGSLFAMIGGAYVTWRAHADDTKSPRERQFVLQMIGVRVAIVSLVFAVSFGISKLDFSYQPVTREILKAAYVFFIYVIAMGLFAYSSRRRQQIQIEEKTFAEAEWTTPRKDTDRVANPHETKSNSDLKAVKSMAFVLILSAIMIFQAPWKQHLGHAILLSAGFGLCLIWSFRLWQNRPRYLSLRLNWVLTSPIFIGLVTLFSFNFHQYQAQVSSDTSSIASLTEVFTFNLVVALAYSVFVGIVAWKRKRECLLVGEKVK